MDECTICQEQILNDQNITTLGGCSHHFHSICIQTWATIGNTCPLCRHVFTENIDISKVLPTLLAMAIIFPMEDQLQRISFAFSFLKLVIQFFGTSAEFNTHKNLIIAFSENYTINNFRLPLLCYSSRNDLHKQCKYLKDRYRSLIGGASVSLANHPFVRRWRQTLLNDPVASMFFLQKCYIGSGVHVYQSVPPLHIS